MIVEYPNMWNIHVPLSGGWGFDPHMVISGNSRQPQRKIVSTFASHNMSGVHVVKAS